MTHALLKHFNTSGIYIIRNLINNKVYIGSAKNIRTRINIHKHYLNNNKHHSKKLQYSYNKYYGNFLVSILEKTSIENLIIREQYWINYFQSYKQEYGFNILKTAGNSIGYKCSEETKKKIGNANRGRKIIFTESHLKNLAKNRYHRKIKVIFNNYEKDFNCIDDLVNELNISKSTVMINIDRDKKCKKLNCKFVTIK